jgi:hypothetical protein
MNPTPIPIEGITFVTSPEGHGSPSCSSLVILLLAALSLSRTGCG